MSTRTADHGGPRPAVVSSAISPAERAILSLLLVDAGAFRTAEEIARHTGICVPLVRQSLGSLTFLGHLGEGWYVTDAGRDALAEAAP